ncbi:MAG: histidinol dehydrogenase [Synergistaceae bacterium]|nr:histidinol dehydrogenase [Synergistaceae bacterium]
MNDSGIKWIKKAGGASTAASQDVRNTVACIIDNVRGMGMEAVTRLSQKFDGFGGPFRTPREEAARALGAISPEVRGALETAIRNVTMFHELQRGTLIDREWEISPGVRAGYRYMPVESAAVYIPGGRYPLPSSAIMSVVPAKAAGVRRIAAFSPPGKNGRVHESVLAVLSLLGVDEIWAIGGAHAIAAMALGAGEIARVDFVAGPGNAYVAEAKRALYGTIGIDGVAGPSEVLIIADGGADFRLTAKDLLAQSEHDPMASGVLVTTSEELAQNVRDEIENLLPGLPTRDVASISWNENGAIGLADSLDSAIEYANAMAPEHLQLAVSDPRETLAKCRAYGAAFLGYSSCEVFGDYIAGTNHTLPTDGRARFSSGLWTGSFMRTLTHLDMTPESAAALSLPGTVIARTEGLEAHARSLLARGDIKD